MVAPIAGCRVGLLRQRHCQLVDLLEDILCPGQAFNLLDALDVVLFESLLHKVAEVLDFLAIVLEDDRLEVS